MADDSSDFTALTADIVSAYVTNNKVEADKLAGIIADVHKALGSAGQPSEPAKEDHTKDKAAIKKSVTPDHLISFEDGRRYKSLKRHLSGVGLTPEEYKAKHGLPKDYPIVAPNYSAQRSALAKTLGLGRKAAAAPEPAPELDPPPAKKGRGKNKAIKPADETFT